MGIYISIKKDALWNGVSKILKGVDDYSKRSVNVEILRSVILEEVKVYDCNHGYESSEGMDVMKWWRVC